MLRLRSGQANPQRGRRPRCQVTRRLKTGDLMGSSESVKGVSAREQCPRRCRSKVRLLWRARNDGKVGIGAFKTLDLTDVVWHRLRSETDHERRAALVCLLTAALAAKARRQSLAKRKAAATVVIGPERQVRVRREFHLQ